MIHRTLIPSSGEARRYSKLCSACTTRASTVLSLPRCVTLHDATRRSSTESHIPILVSPRCFGSAPQSFHSCCRCLTGGRERPGIIEKPRKRYLLRGFCFVLYFRCGEIFLFAGREFHRWSGEISLRLRMCFSSGPECPSPVRRINTRQALQQVPRRRRPDRPCRRRSCPHCSVRTCRSRTSCGSRAW